MFIPVTAALGALSSVSSLIDSATSSLSNSLSNNFSSLGQAATTATAQPPSSAASIGNKFDIGTLSALISAQSQTSASANSQASALFKKLDANGDGQVSKSEFESALSAVGVDSVKADSLFAKLDANGDGTLSQSELTPPRGAYYGAHHHHVGGGSVSGGGGALSLMNATNADGSTAQTTTNSDGSTTTTITYVDGSTVSMTNPAAQSIGTKQNSTNLIEKLIQMQSALLNTQVSATAAIA